MTELSTELLRSSIAAVERETGLSKDLLRVWERRYGFPQPGRDANGERIYSEDDITRLRVVRRLVDQGMRPGRILALSLAELEDLLRGTPATACSAQQDLVLYLVKTHQTRELGEELRQALVRDGLRRFVTETVAPLATLVGEAWVRGEIQIYEEHLFTEQLQAVLRNAIAQTHSRGGSPRVLLTTLPSEQHVLGLLMAEALLALEGAECVLLGTQTPTGDVVAAARAKEVDVVALSFSGNFPLNQMSHSIALLRSALPPAIAFWVGGGGVQRVKRLPLQVKRIAALEAIGLAVTEWRTTSGEQGRGG